MKICIVSDSHDRAGPLAAAVRAAKAAGAQAVIHCGDVIGAHTLRALVPLGLPVHVVHGNNVGDPIAMQRVCDNSNGIIRYHGADADLQLAGKRVFATHFPHYGRGLACTGDYDLVCCGHSHQASIVQQPDIRGARTWLVNPGTVAGVGGEASWLLGDLATMSFEVHRLEREAHGFD